jgi:hypothetical protein
VNAWEEYLAAVRVSPGDIVEMMPDGKHGLPVVLDPGNCPAGYRPGTYRCLNCGHDPYDPQCCRQRARGGSDVTSVGA